MMRKTAEQMSATEKKAEKTQRQEIRLAKIAAGTVSLFVFSCSAYVLIAILGTTGWVRKGRIYLSVPKCQIIFKLVVVAVLHVVLSTFLATLNIWRLLSSNQELWRLKLLHPGTLCFTVWVTPSSGKSYEFVAEENHLEYTLKWHKNLR